MEVEIEAKFLDIDVNKIRDKLKTLGASLVHSEILMKRRTFDFPGLILKNKGGWVRVRDEGNCITMSYKKQDNLTLTGTKEITIKTDNFEVACDFLEKLGMLEKAHQETKREKWLLDGNEVTIDQWPWIPPVVEIEGGSEDGVREVSKKLGFDWSQAKHGPIAAAYQVYFKVSEDEINEMPAITFSPTPDWLEKRRIIK